MKNVTSKILVLAGLFSLAVSCSKNSSNSYDFAEYKNSSPKTGLNTSKRLNNQITLKPVTEERYSNPALEKLQEELNRTRAERSQKLLNLFSTEDERIDIKEVLISTKEDGVLSLNVKTIKEDTHKITELVFESDDSSSEEVSFSLYSGRNDHSVKARGYCLNLKENICYDLVVEVSYLLKNKRIIRQFNFQKPEEEDTVEEVQKPEEIIVESPSDQKEIPKIEVDTSVKNTEIIEEKGPATPKVLETVPPTQPDAQLTREQTPTPHDQVKAETASDDDITTAPLTAAPVKSIRPKPRPLDFKQTPASSEANEETPDEEGANIAGSIFVLPEDTSSESTAGLHFRDIGVEANSYAELNPKDYPSSEDEEDTVSNIDMLSDFKSQIYGQSKGGYGGRLGRGYMKNSEKINTLEKGVVARKESNSRRYKQFGSSLSVGFLKWLGAEFSIKYPNSPICVNDISKKKGGRIGHKSHENGLDMDISIPTNQSDCVSSRFKKYHDSDDHDRDFYKKNWDFLKLMISTNRVHVIFIDKGFTKKMCDYTKTLDLSAEEKKQRKIIFNKLYHVGGHKNHYHVRMVCNNQNTGCKKQGVLKGRTCN